jgi:hypothetical protein
VKHVVFEVALIAALVLGLGSCGDNQASQPDTSVDTPPYVDPAFLMIDHGTNPFGSVDVGLSSSPATFTVTNTGDEASGTPTVSLGGPDASEFQLTTTCSTALVANGTCAVSVTFAPASAGAKTATLSVGANPGGTVTAALSGAGLAPGALAVGVTSSSLGNVVVGETGTTTALVTVTNEGDTPTGALALQAAGSDPVDFTTTEDLCTGQTLAADATCTFRIAFAPRSAGVKTTAYRIGAVPAVASTWR